MIYRILLLISCSLFGLFIAVEFYGPASWPVGGGAGLLIALLVIQFEQAIHKVSLKTITGGLLGLSIGVAAAIIIAYIVTVIFEFPDESQVIPWLYALPIAALGYIGCFLGIRKIDEIPLLNSGNSKRGNDKRIIDTSIIIDGRIADICECGFLDGTMIIPRFVLDELHYVADSADPLKRARGRRGLDILNRLRQMDEIRIEIVDRDYPEIKGVDAKLVALAKDLSGKIVTNDFNLSKVAALQEIKALNINMLANAVKPLVLPGESLQVKIVKEGREPGQGVGYLDDGTMIVVDNAQHHLGFTKEALVTSILQTSAGRMIFCELPGPAGEKKPNQIQGKP